MTCKYCGNRLIEKFTDDEGFKVFQCVKCGACSKMKRGTGE